jgi:hypothetical protein
MDATSHDMPSGVYRVGPHAHGMAFITVLMTVVGLFVFIPRALRHPTEFAGLLPWFAVLGYFWFKLVNSVYKVTIGVDRRLTFSSLRYRRQVLATEVSAVTVLRGDFGIHVHFGGEKVWFPADRNESYQLLTELRKLNPNVSVAGGAVSADNANSPFRELLHAAGVSELKGFVSLEQARSSEKAFMILEGDDGGQIFVVAPIGSVKASLENLTQLLIDLDERSWGPDGYEDARRIYFAEHEVGDIVPGGMGGGVASKDVWVHSKLVDLDLRSAIVDVIVGVRERLEA